MTDIFAPYMGLYGPDAFPKAPWWQHGPGTWTRSDHTWEVFAGRLASTTCVDGEIVVSRLDLKPDDPEVRLLRKEWNPLDSTVDMKATVERIKINGGTDFYKFETPDHPFYSRVIDSKQMTPSDMAVLVEETLRRLDHELPVSHPPVWPGQLWLQLSETGYRPVFIDKMPTLQPLPEIKNLVALLYGPTPWGRDIPWIHPMYRELTCGK